MRARRVFILTAFVLLVPIALAGSLAMERMARQERETALRGLRETARANALAVDREIASAIASLRGLALSHDLFAPELRRFHQSAQKLDEPPLRWTVLLDEDGSQLVNTLLPFGASLPGPQASAQQLVAQVLRTGQPMVSDVQQGAISEQPITVVLVPVPAEEGGRLVLLHTVTHAYWTRKVLGADGANGWIVGMTDQAGHFVARSRNPERFVGTPGSPEVLAAARAARHGLLRISSLEGELLYVAFTHTDTANWVVGVGAPAAQIEAPVRRARRIALAGLGTTLSFVLAAILLLARGVAREFRQLAEGTRALGAWRRPNMQPSRILEIDQLQQEILHAATLLHQERASHEAARKALRDATTRFQQVLMTEVEARQAQLARELHDAVAAPLAGIQLLLASAMASSNGQASQMLHRVQEALSQAARAARELSRGIMPVGTDAGALLHALEQFAARTGDHPGLECSVRARGDFTHVGSEAGTHLYRIVQEAVANAIRHGQATRVRIALVQHRGHHRLVIRDNGSGCEFGEVQEAHPGMGLRSMRARTLAIGGRLDLDCPRGRGCRVRVTWPAGF